MEQPKKLEELQLLQWQRQEEWKLLVLSIHIV